MSTQGEATPEPSDNRSQPPVIFDIRLGRYVKSIDFNVEEYVAYCLAQGMPEQDVMCTPVRVVPWKSGKSGNYTPASDGKPGEIRVAVIRASLRPATSQSLSHIGAHEVEHLADDALGRLSPLERGMARVSNVAQLVGGSLIGVSLGGGLGAAPFHAPEVQAAARTVGAAGVACAALGALIYRMNPAERRARRAAKQAHPEFIQVEMKPYWQLLGALARSSYETAKTP